MTTSDRPWIDRGQPHLCFESARVGQMHLMHLMHLGGAVVLPGAAFGAPHYPGHQTGLGAPLEADQ